jgi:ligand-binding SRPBCC domain-containing protein
MGIWGRVAIDSLQGREVSVHRLQRRQVVRRQLTEVFDFFSRSGNLEQITPAWLHFDMRSPEPAEMRVGTEIEYRLRLHGIPLRWVSRIDQWERDRMFVDRQLHGPYRLWLHRHEFTSVPGGTVVLDSVDYALPFGPLGELAGPAFVRRDLERIFDHRAAAVARLLG